MQRLHWILCTCVVFLMSCNWHFYTSVCSRILRVNLSMFGLFPDSFGMQSSRHSVLHVFHMFLPWQMHQVVEHLALYPSSGDMVPQICKNFHLSLLSDFEWLCSQVKFQDDLTLKDFNVDCFVQLCWFAVRWWKYSRPSSGMDHSSHVGRWNQKKTGSQHTSSPHSSLSKNNSMQTSMPFRAHCVNTGHC